MRSAAWIGWTTAAGALSLASADFAHELERAATVRDALVVALPANLLILAVGLAAVLVALGWKRRLGHHPHCSRCGYPFLNGEELVCVCPECGSPWRWIGRTVEGQPASRPAMVTAGALLGVASSGLLLLGAASPQTLLRAAPEPLVVAHAGGAPWYASLESWRNVRERTLSPRAAAWLASRIRTQQRQNAAVLHEAEVWLYDTLHARSAAPAPTPARTP